MIKTVKKLISTSGLGLLATLSACGGLNHKRYHGAIDFGKLFSSNRTNDSVATNGAEEASSQTANIHCPRVAEDLPRFGDHLSRLDMGIPIANDFPGEQTLSSKNQEPIYTPFGMAYDVVIGERLAQETLDQRIGSSSENKANRYKDWLNNNSLDNFINRNRRGLTLNRVPSYGLDGIGNHHSSFDDDWEGDRFGHFEHQQRVGLRVVKHLGRAFFEKVADDIPIVGAARDANKGARRFLSSPLRWVFPDMHTGLNVRFNNNTLGFELRGYDDDGLSISIGVDKITDTDNMYITMEKLF